MVAAVLSIRAALLHNAYARQPASLIGAAIVTVVLLGATIAGCVLITGAPVEPGDRARWAVVGGSALAVSWTLAPLLLFGSDRSLSADSLRLFPLRRRDAMVGLGVASLMSLPGLALCCAAALLVAVATPTWAVLPAACVVAMAGLLLTAVARQIVLDALAVVAGTRHRREIMGIAVLALVVVAVPIALLVARSDALMARLSVPVLAPVLAWTPFGAPWAIPEALHEGRHGDAAGYAVVLLVTLVASLVVWSKLVAQRLKPVAAQSHGRPGRGLGFLSAVPDSVTGAVAARTLIGWVRDPRYSAMWVFALVLPALGAGLSILGGTYWPMVIYALTSLFLVTTTGALDVSNDGLSHAAHLTVPVRGRPDALGRLAGHALAAMPLIIIATVISFLVLEPLTAVGFFGVVAAVGGGSLGAARATTARVIVPVSNGGEDAQDSRPGSGVPTLVHYAISGAAAGTAALPPLVLTMVAAAVESWPMAVAAAVAGTATAVVSVLLGILLGARTLDRRPQRTYADIVRLS